MSRNDPIVVVVDPAARHHAGLAKGALLAKMFETGIDLFACSSPSQAATSQADANIRVAEASEILQALARPLRERGLHVTTETVHAESLNAALDEHVKHSRARLVIKDVRRQASGGAALSFSDRELARACPASLLLSKARLWPALPKICAAIESKQGQQKTRTPLEDAVMEQGTVLSLHLGGELDVLHACGQLLTRIVNQLATTIVVMGAASGGAPSRQDGIGSSAENVLNQLSCDVLLVKAPPAASVLH